MNKSIYEIFNRNFLKVKPFSERVSDLSVDSFPRLDDDSPYYDDSNLSILVDKIIAAFKINSQVVLLMGAHVIRSGVSRYIIDLMERGYLTHIAMNGACPIHEYELARFGKTTENVARYISEGQFGLWKETGEINDIINISYKEKLGLGEGIGRSIERSNYPHKDLSILAAGYRLKIPVTVHVGIGYDILHEHPNCNGAALGDTSYRDFLIFTRSIQGLEGGVIMCFGSQVMGPEVFLKALAMARNVAHQNGKRITQFTTAVFDLIDIGKQYQSEPLKTNSKYYFRPWKTLLARVISDGGESFYFQGNHKVTIPTLYQLIKKRINIQVTQEKGK